MALDLVGGGGGWFAARVREGLGRRIHSGGALYSVVWENYVITPGWAASAWISDGVLVISRPKMGRRVKEHGCPHVWFW